MTHLLIYINTQITIRMTYLIKYTDEHFFFFNYRSVLSMGLTTELQTEAVICCLCGPMILFTCFLCN